MMSVVPESQMVVPIESTMAPSRRNIDASSGWPATSSGWRACRRSITTPAMTRSAATRSTWKAASDVSSSPGWMTMIASSTSRPTNGRVTTTTATIAATTAATTIEGLK